MCARVVSEDFCLMVYCHEKYKTQRICDEAVDDYLAALKYIPDWFVTSKMTKKLFTALHADDNRLYFNKDSGNIVFSCNEIGIINIYLHYINIDDTNYNGDDPETIIHIRLLAWHIKLEKRKALRKELNEEIMPIQWHSKRWQNFCMSEDEKKEVEPIFTEYYF